MKKIFVLLMVSIFLVGCSGFVTLNTNLPLNTSKITVINNTNCNLYLLIDGKMKNGSISPAGIRTFGFWVGGGAYSSQVRVSVSILDPAKNRSWSEVINLSSYYKYSYVFTVREERGQLQTEVRY
jgi:hypothetical protein